MESLMTNLPTTMQLNLKHFVEENFNVQILLTADTSTFVGRIFNAVVKEHALGYHSLRHLDMGTPTVAVKNILVSNVQRAVVNSKEFLYILQI